MITIEQIKELLHKELNKELNKELKGLEERLEQKLEQKLEPIRIELKEVKNNLGKINDEIIKLKNYNKNESIGIEYEISKNVKYFLYEKYKGTIIKNFKIKNIINPITQQQITEFDGVYILSYNDYPSKKKTKLNDNSGLVIIEAKHHITIEQIKEKILQIYKIVKYLDIIKRFSNKDDLYKYTFNNETYRKIEGHIKHLSLDKITKIYFFIGGPTWEENSINYCKNINNGIITSTSMRSRNQLNDDFYLSNKDDIDNFILNYLKNNIAVIVPSGLRYEINDFNNNLSLNNIIEEKDLLLSKERTINDIEKERITIGGNKNNGLMMKILPNYMNFKYT